MTERGHQHHEHNHNHSAELKPSVNVRWFDGPRRRANKRFDYAYSLASNLENPAKGTDQNNETSPKMMDIITKTAKRTGKEQLLLDPNFSDDQLEHFAHTFSSLYDSRDKKAHKPIISNLFKRSVVGGNVLIGAAEALTAGSVSAVWGDAIHNGADAYVYNEQLNNVQEPTSTKAKSYRRRKAMYTILALGSAGIATKAGIDFIIDLTSDQETDQNAYAIYTAGASVLFNGGIGIARYRQMRKHKDHNDKHVTHHDHDVNKHLMVDSASAGLALIGAVSGASILSPFSGVLSGLLGAKLFYPSEANLRHSYHAHGEETHDDDSHAHQNHHTHGVEESGQTEEHSAKKKTSKLKKTAAAGTAFALLSGGGILGAKSLSNSQEVQNRPPQITKTEETPAISLGLSPSQKELKVTRTMKIKKGDNQWEIVEQALEGAGYTATPGRINVIVDLTAAENIATIPNPDKFEIGESLQVPNEETIDRIVSTMEDPANDPSLAADLDTLNEQPDISKKEVIAKERTRIKRIWNVLKKN